MRYLALAAITLFALGCTTDSPKTPEQVRQDTANATQAVVAGAKVAAADVKGAAEGLKDGLHQQATANSAPETKVDAVDINSASRATLETLPGITPAVSRQIVAHRPYASPLSLKTRRVLTESQYDAISNRIVAN